MPRFRRRPEPPEVRPSARVTPLHVDADRSRRGCLALIVSGEPIPCDLATPAGAIRCSACLRLSGDGQRRRPSVVHPETSSLDEPCSTPDRSATRLLGNGGTWRDSLPVAFVCEAHFAFAERHGFSHEAGGGENYWIARLTEAGWRWRDGSPIEDSR